MHPHNAVERMENILDAALADGVPGISVAIATTEGILWTKTAGYADLSAKTPVRSDHLFGIGSITKTFVAVVILQLVEEGRISLDQTPASIVGDAVKGVANADRATLAHLLNHTSGIPSWEDDPTWIREGRGAALDVNRRWGKRDTLPYIANTPALFEPGAQYSYSNSNHTVLGLVIEAVTGNAAVEEIRQRVLQPIGVDSIYLEGFEPLPSDCLAARYHHATETFKQDAGVADAFTELRPGLIDVSASNLSVEWTAGGMVAEAGALARYAVALSQGQLLSEESMAVVSDWFPVKDGVEVGHGVFRYENAAGFILGHGGDVLGYTANMHWIENTDIAVVVLTNVGTMHTGGGQPNAYAIGRNSPFMQAAADYVSSAAGGD